VNDTAATDSRIRGLVLRGESRDRVAAAVGLTVEEVNARVTAIWKTIRQRNRPDDGDDDELDGPAPSPEEIAAEAAALRQRWSQAEADRRWVRGGPR
jgi:hypothetical protein